MNYTPYYRAPAARQLVASDARVHPWPLGVATYRHFPAQLPMAPDGTAVRRHLCNFMGTVSLLARRAV